MAGSFPSHAVFAEGVGTCLFQFIGGAAASNSLSTGLATSAIGNGLALVVLMYATLGLSGGHLNPAVSTGLFVTGRMGTNRYLMYCGAQVAGAVIGAFALKLALPPALDETPFTTTGSLTFTHPFQVFFLEFFCTFFLVYTFFGTVVDRTGVAKNAAPLAVGLTVLVGVFAEGPYTGGSMNPARTLGPAIAFGQLKHVWVYLLSTLAGGAVAGLTYDKLFLEATQPAEKRDRDEE